MILNDCSTQSVCIAQFSVISFSSTFQASIDRLPQLHAQCRSWRGPLSVVLFVGLFESPTDELGRSNNLSASSVSGRRDAAGRALLTENGNDGGTNAMEEQREGRSRRKRGSAGMRRRGPEPSSSSRHHLSASNIKLLHLASRLITASFAKFEKDDAKSSCALDIVLAYEVYSERKAMMLYPINTLR